MAEPKSDPVKNADGEHKKAHEPDAAPRAAVHEPAPRPIPPVAERKVEPQKELTFQEHGWRQMHFDAIAAVGVQPEDVLKRDYWAHVAQRSLRAMTKISMMAEDRSWYGELVVFQTFSNGALVAFVHPPVRIASSGMTREESEYEVSHEGLIKNWCVKRRSDGRVLSDSHPSSAEADMWLSNWLKAQGSSARRAA